MAQVDFNYDKENDILSVHKGFDSDEKFDGNIDAGDVILDISSTGRVIGIEILNASSFFKEYNIALQVLSGVDFEASSPGNIINMVLRTREKQVPAKIAVPIAV